MNTKTLHYFTHEYPYGLHETFITNELNSLSRHYKYIYIYPLLQKNKKEIREIPENCKIINYKTEKDIYKYKFIFSHFFTVLYLLLNEIFSQKKLILKKVKKSTFSHRK